MADHNQYQFAQRQTFAKSPQIVKNQSGQIVSMGGIELQREMLIELQEKPKRDWPVFQQIEKQNQQDLYDLNNLQALHQLI